MQGRQYSQRNQYSQGSLNSQGDQNDPGNQKGQGNQYSQDNQLGRSSLNNRDNQHNRYDQHGQYGGQSGDSIIDNTYIIQEEIGSGSGGVVYRAWHRRLQKPVVLKKMKISRSSVAENRRETDILKQLRHSYLPGVIDFIDLNGEVFTVMDFIEGRSLAEALRGGQRFSQDQAVTYTGQLLEALAYLHRQKPPVIHGDIKPGNIMLTPEGNVCLIDFDISGYLTDNRFFVKGYTQGYAAPEQVRAIQKAMYTGGQVPPGAFDERADLYSAGAVLFTLLTGYRPHQDWDKMQALLEQMGISDGLTAVLYRALQPDPHQRYSSAQQMLEELRNYRKIEWSYRRKVMGRRLLLFSALGAVLAALVITAGVLQMRKNAREKEYQRNLTDLETLAENAASGGTQTYEERYGEATELYDACSSLYPDRLEPLVQMSRFLYISKEYDTCIRLIRGDLVVPDGEPEEPKAYGEICYILGNACYETGQMEDAVQAYEKAAAYLKDNPGVFRDYAIALARSGNLTGAKQILDDAEEHGLKETQIALVQGEIFFREGNYEEAISRFRFCMDNAEDDTDLLRACLLASQVFEGMGITEDNMIRSAQMLEDGRVRLPNDKKAPVLERLAQTYIYLYDLTEIPSYAEKSIDVFDQIIQNGWSTVLTYNNIVVMYQKIGNLDTAKEYAARMEELWPEDYRTYKRLAFLEEASQGTLEAEDRDYTSFVRNYKKAKELFTAEGGTDDQDAEMRILDDIYTQILDNGWI